MLLLRAEMPCPYTGGSTTAILHSPLHRHFFIAKTSKPQQPRSVVTTPLSLSSSGETRPLDVCIYASETEIPKQYNSLGYDQTSSSRLRVQHLIERIRALPTSNRAHILDDYNGGTCGLSHFNNLLLALVKAEEPDLAFKLYSDLSSHGLAPDSRTLSTMIRCHCLKNDMYEALRILDLMVDMGFQPNVSTLTLLINSLCIKGRLQKAFQVFDAMARIGCKPTIQTYNCLIKGLCYVGRVEEAYEMLATVKADSDIKPDIYTYTSLMDGFCKVGRSDEAMELLGEALQMGLKPNAVTFNTLFNGFCKEGRPLEGIDVLKQMKESCCMPDYISYSTLLHGLLKWDETRMALWIYKEMSEIGFDLDDRILNSLLRGLCRRSLTEEEFLEDAYHLFDKMKCRIHIDYATTKYGPMIGAFFYFQQMINLGHAPRTITFNNLVQALCIGEKVEAALSVLLLMYEGGKVPDIIAFDLLISKLKKKGAMQAACNVYGVALKEGLFPNQKPVY